MEDTKLISYYKGETSDEDSRLITEWLNASSDNLLYYKRLCRIFEINYWSEENAEKQQRSKIRIPVKKIFIEISKIAAVFILGFMLNSLFFSQEEKITYHKIHVPEGQHTELTLADGSQVWLNSNSLFIFPSTFSESKRLVQLTGEGFFKVKADKNRPFTVSTPQCNVTALGTAFNVYDYDSSCFETALLSGKVTISNLKNNEDAIMLTPNTSAVLNDGKLEISPIIDSNRYLWREGILYFNGSLLEAFEKLQQYFNVTIHVKNSMILNNQLECRGKFRTKDGLEHILKVLQETKHFFYVYDYENKRVSIL